VRIDNVTYTLANNAARRPDHIALVYRDEKVTHLALEQRVQKYAGALHEQGIKPGQIVAVSMHDTIDLIVVIFALMRLGAVLLPIDFHWTAPERERVAAAFDSNLIITDIAIPTPPGMRSIEIDESWKIAAANAPAVTGWSTTAQSPLLLSLSSGTTGIPKGPLVTHELYMARLFYETHAVSTTQDDINMCALPMYFGAGRNITLQHIMLGATVIMFAPPYNVEDLVKEIDEQGVTSVFLVPTILRRLLKLPGIQPPLFPKLRALMSGAAMLYEEETRQVRTVLTPKFYLSYATTEAGVVSYLTPEHDDTKLGSVGRPAFLCDLQIVDDQHQPVGRGEIGHISFNTPAVPEGFYNNPQATAESFHAGRFLPGDLGRLDDDGYLYVVGRSKDVIIRGGVNIYPADVESSLSSSPAVVDVSVVGWPIGEMGEEVAAIVVTKEPVTEAALMEHCRGQLARYKMPRRIFFMQRLPRNEGGKVSKQRLTELLPKEIDGVLASEQLTG
jgi:acyl-CoA synthetase (AMP-forming)/AMP-acid ligase II